MKDMITKQYRQQQKTKPAIKSSKDVQFDQQLLHQQFFKRVYQFLQRGDKKGVLDSSKECLI